MGSQLGLLDLKRQEGGSGKREQRGGKSISVYTSSTNVNGIVSKQASSIIKWR